MTDFSTIQGRRIGPLELAQVRAFLTEHPDWSRYRLSRQLATLWDWRNSVGQLKDMAARTLLLKLAQRGWITLPACRCASPNRIKGSVNENVISSVADCPPCHFLRPGVQEDKVRT